MHNYELAMYTDRETIYINNINIYHYVVQTAFYVISFLPQHLCNEKRDWHSYSFIARTCKIESKKIIKYDTQRCF